MNNDVRFDSLKFYSGNITYETFVASIIMCAVNTFSGFKDDGVHGCFSPANQKKGNIALITIKIP